MDLNQQTLRGILAQILSVNEAFIVPKQGNWWNPQEKMIKPDTWCAYMIHNARPRTVPFYYTKETGNKKVNVAIVEKISNIDLQFVGPQAENIAQSVALWPLRADVQEQFERVQGSLLYDDMDATSSIFYQDGSNTITAWNVTIRVLWYQTIDTQQKTFPNTELSGNVK